MNQIDRLHTLGEPKMTLSHDCCGDDYARAGAGKVEELRDLIRRLLAKLPHVARDLSVGWCAGCHALQWCGDGQGAEPCAPDCVLQEAKAAVEER